MNRLWGIYAIVDAASSRDPERDVAAVMRGGVRLIQYRAKHGVDRALVRELHRLTRRDDALLIVNDDIAAAEDADGLHVGQEDLAVLGSGVRRRIGRRILGISCGTPAEGMAAREMGADYLGVGPFAGTPSKDDAGPPIGAAGLSAVVEVAGDLPVAAIGGIGLGQLGEVIASGATMAAVLSALRATGDPELAARALVGRWNELAR